MMNTLELIKPFLPPVYCVVQQNVVLVITETRWWYVSPAQESKQKVTTYTFLNGFVTLINPWLMKRGWPSVQCWAGTGFNIATLSRFHDLFVGWTLTDNPHMAMALKLALKDILGDDAVLVALDMMNLGRNFQDMHASNVLDEWGNNNLPKLLASLQVAA